MPLAFWNYSKTNYTGGGLLPSTVLKSRSNTYKATKKFVAPSKLDFRDMCIETSDQGQTPHCAGFATAGYVEVVKWQENHYPEQFDGDAIYNEAKKIDGNSEEGTSLNSAVAAAIALNLISGKPKFVDGDEQSLKFAIHSQLVCVAGFMITDEWNMVNKKTGLIADYGDKAVELGGHAVLVCGYDKDGIYIQNSWSKDWGLWGFGLLSWKQVIKQYMYGMVIV
jgi:hypothetical protein